MRTFSALADDHQSDDLKSRIAAARAADESRAVGGTERPLDKGYAQGSRVLAMLLGSLIGGGILGYALDTWLGTLPWATLIVLTLAVIGAFMNIIRMSKERAQ